MGSKWEKEVHLASAENGNDNFNSACGYCKKKAEHKCKDCLHAKLSNLDLDLDLGLGMGRNVAHVARMDTLMLNVRKSILIKVQNGTRI